MQLVERPVAIPEERIASQKGHLPSFDGLRALSIAIVLLGHFLLPPRLLGVSAFGVLIFFFISGFLITRLLYAERKSRGDISLRDFYLRRFLRLYPVVVVFMIVVIGVALARGLRLDPLEIASVFGYFTNYLVAWRDVHGFVAPGGEHTTLPIGVLWSLSVEEHFYFLMPALFLLAKGDPQRMLRVAVGLCVASLLIRLAYAEFFRNEIGLLGIYKRSETRFDAIAFGVIMATLCELPAGRAFVLRLANARVFFCAALVLLLSFAIRNEFFESTLRYTIQSACLFPIFATILFSTRVRWLNLALNLRPVSWIGKLSYSIYVWHGGALFLAGTAIARLPLGLKSWGEVGASLIFAVASYYCVERPFLRLRTFFHARSGQYASGVAKA